MARAIVHIAALIAASPSPAVRAQSAELAPYKIVGDGIAESLTGTPGDAARGRALVLARTHDLHPLPFRPVPGNAVPGRPRA